MKSQKSPTTLLSATLLLTTLSTISHAFLTPTTPTTSTIINRSTFTSTSYHSSPSSPSSPFALSMALDPVTYLRTEWVAAALCTNQTPRSADKVLQLGCEDGRVVNFVPRTIREIITSSAEKEDDPESGGAGGLTVSCERQLRQMATRRASGLSINFSNQRADNLSQTPSSSVDVVISLQAAQRMAENGLDWKRSVQEAGRVLKPGGRFLFVESNEVNGESYLDYVSGLSELGGVEIKSGGENTIKPAAAMGSMDGDDDDESEDDEEKVPSKPKTVFDEVGYDQVDMVLQPHIAGVAIKAMDADLSASQKAQKKVQEEEDRLAELSLNAFERGSKRRKRKKKKSKAGSMDGGEE